MRMFNFFRKKPPMPTAPDVLYFKNTQGAFEYSCKFSFAEVTAGQPRVAIVDNAPAGHDAKGFQSVILRVAGHDDYFEVIASTAAPFVPPLQSGDLVLWLPME